jgi:hypothetical protein
MNVKERTDNTVAALNYKSTEDEHVTNQNGTALIYMSIRPNVACSWDHNLPDSRTDGQTSNSPRTVRAIERRLRRYKK